jgi:CotH kinase protein/Putative metal-binding motif
MGEGVMSRLAWGWAAGVVIAMTVAACSSGRPVTGQIATGGGSATGGTSATGGSAGTDMVVTVPDASNSGRTCSDLFDQTKLPTFSFEISADNWAKLNADFHDLKDVLAGTPPQTYYPVTFHFGPETVTTAAVRLRGKSSWVNTVMFDANPKMQFVIAFDQVVPKQKFHGLSSLHLAMARDDWTFLNERIGNNWFREVGIAAPCSNSAKVNVNGEYYGLYVAEGGVNQSLLTQFFPGNANGDLFKGGTEAQTNMAGPNWTRLLSLQRAADLASLQAVVDLPGTVLEWAAEAVINDADGYYGGAHNYYVYDEGAAGFVWLPDHADSSLEWLELFSSLSYKQHPIFWWVGRPFAEVPPQDYLIVLDDPTWRAHYTDAIATQAGKWNVTEILGWIDTWSAQIADAVAADPHRWATPDQFHAALAATRDVAMHRPDYLQSFVACERGAPADSTDQDGDGAPWCNDCDDGNPAIRPGAAEICGNGVDDNCDGRIDEGCTTPADAGTGG